MSGRELDSNEERDEKITKSLIGGKNRSRYGAMKKSKSKKRNSSVSFNPTRSTLGYETMGLSFQDDKNSSDFDPTRSQLGYGKMGLSGLTDPTYFTHHDNNGGDDDDDDDNRIKTSKFSYESMKIDNKLSTGDGGSHYGSNSNHDGDSASFFASSNGCYSSDDDFDFDALKVMDDSDHTDVCLETETRALKFYRIMVSNFGIFRYVVGGIVNNNNVQFIIVLLISIGAILMGVDAIIEPTSQLAITIVNIEMYFLMVYTVEIIMQFIYHGHRLFFDGWLIFDLIIVMISLFLKEYTGLRSLRIFRALRLVARIKVMKNLLLAIIGVLPRMLAILLLLAIVMYIFAVMFSQLFHELFFMGVTSVDYFGTLPKTFLTLFQITTMDGWARINREVMAYDRFAWMYFIVYIMFTGLIIVNLIIAVICDAISALHDDDKAKLLGMYDGIHENDDPATSEEDDDTGDHSRDFFGTSSSSQMNTDEQFQCLIQNIEDHKRIHNINTRSAEHLLKRLSSMKTITTETMQQYHRKKK